MMSHSPPEWVVAQYQESQERLAKYYEVFVHNKREEHDALEDELPNLLTALQWSLERSPQQVVDLVNDLGNFFQQRGFWREGIVFSDAAEKVARALYKKEPDDEKRAFDLVSIQLQSIGFLLWQGEVEEARERLEQVLDLQILSKYPALSGGVAVFVGAIAELEDDDQKMLLILDAALNQLQNFQHLPLTSALLGRIAEVLGKRGEYEKAFDLYRKKIEIDRQTKDIESLIDSLRGLAEIARSAGLNDLAEKCFREADELSQTASVPGLRYETLSDIARMAQQRGDYQKAADHYAQALEIARQTRDRNSIASTLRFLAFAEEELGKDILPLLEESLSISRELNDFDGMVMSMLQLGDVYQAKGDFERAKAQYRQGAEIASRIHNAQLTAQAYLQLGDLALEQESWREAEHNYKESLSNLDRQDNIKSRALVLRGLGQAFWMQDQLADAKASIQESAEINHRGENWEVYAENLYALATIAAQDDEIVTAQNLAQRALEILNRIGSPHAAEVKSALEGFQTSGSRDH